MDQPYAYCTFCGAPFSEHAGWPRTCANCENTSFRNPLPVCVILVPIDGGVLAVRRAIPPGIGQLALPGGYINFGETWQEAGAREVFEETGLRIDPQEIREFRVRSAPDGTLIIFGTTRPYRAADLPAFSGNEEASERVILTGSTRMAFGLHEEMVQWFFDADGLSPLS
jgi:ADP-ribose pyrophosphatase YjhB (NUDIX family)